MAHPPFAVALATPARGFLRRFHPSERGTASRFFSPRSYSSRHFVDTFARRFGVNVEVGVRTMHTHRRFGRGARLAAVVFLIATSAEAERSRRRDHVAPSGSFGSFLGTPAMEPAIPRTGFVAMTDLRPPGAERFAAREESAAAAETGWDGLARRFEVAPPANPLVVERYGRERSVAFSPCFSRTTVEDLAEPVFRASAGTAVVLTRAAGTLAAGLVEDESLVSPLFVDSPARIEAWARVRDTAATSATLVRKASSEKIEFGPSNRSFRDGDEDVQRETRLSVRGTPTDTLAHVTVVERRTDRKTRKTAVVLTEKYCR